MLINKIFRHYSLVIILFLTVFLISPFDSILAQETAKKKPKGRKEGPVHVVFPFGKLKTPRKFQVEKPGFQRGQSGRSVSPSGTVTIMSDGFETSQSPGVGLPDTGADLWSTYSTGGFDAHYWDDQSNAELHGGSWSMWCADGGLPSLTAGTDNYPNRMSTWAVYGPFSLSGAFDGFVRFYFKGKTESSWDFFRVLISTDGTNFYGREWSGDYSAAWQYVYVDLNNFNGMNFTGHSLVWVAFVFSSDTTSTTTGIWVDDILISKSTADNAPVNSRLFKSNSAGASATFVPVYQDSDGADDLDSCYFLINDTLSPSNAVYIGYDAFDNLLYLRNDAATSWGTGVTPGSDVTLSNSQGTVKVADVKVIKSGERLKFEIPVRFFGQWASTKSMYLSCEDRGGLSDGWDFFGTFLTTNEAPTLVKLIPDSGSGNDQTFTASYDDLNGSNDFRYLYFKVADTSGQQAGCAYFRYRRVSNKIDLRSDFGGAWYGGYVIGTANTLQNSQVSVDVSTIAVTSTTDTNMVLTLPLHFKDAFMGSHLVYMNAYDMSYATPGWIHMKNWHVPGSTVAPTNVSVIPNNGSGGWKTFDVTYADANGAADFKYLYFKVNSGFGNDNCAYVRYRHVSGKLDLRNDAGSAWIDGGTIGTAATVSNSQVSINLQFVTISTAGNNMTIRLPMVFDSSFNGIKNLYMFCTDLVDLSSSWQDMGDFNVTATAPPAGVSSRSVSLSGIEILPGTRIFLDDYASADGETSWWINHKRLRRVNPSFRFVYDGMYSVDLVQSGFEGGELLTGNDLFVGEKLMKAGDLVGWNGSEMIVHDNTGRLAALKITQVKKKDRIIRLRGHMIPGTRIVFAVKRPGDYYFLDCRAGDAPERWNWVLGRYLDGEEIIVARKTIKPSDSVRLLELVIDPASNDFNATLDGKRLFPRNIAVQRLAGTVGLLVPEHTGDLDIIVSRKMK